MIAWIEVNHWQSQRSRARRKIRVDCLKNETQNTMSLLACTRLDLRRPYSTAASILTLPYFWRRLCGKSRRRGPGKWKRWPRKRASGPWAACSRRPADQPCRQPSDRTGSETRAAREHQTHPPKAFGSDSRFRFYTKTLSNMRGRAVGV